MKNDDPRFMDVKNTYLCILKDSKPLRDSELEDHMRIILPGNLTLGSLERDLLKICPKLKFTGNGKKESDGITYEKSSNGSVSVYTITNPSGDSLKISISDRKICDIAFSRYADWSE